MGDVGGGELGLEPHAFGVVYRARPFLFCIYIIILHGIMHGYINSNKLTCRKKMKTQNTSIQIT